MKSSEIKKYKFANSALKESIKNAIKSGKNPSTGRKYTKKEIEHLKSLL